MPLTPEEEQLADEVAQMLLDAFDEQAIRVPVEDPHRRREVIVAALNIARAELAVRVV